MPDKRFAAVSLPVPLDTVLTYAVPEPLRDGLVAGRRIEVPLATRTMAAWCVGFAEPPEPGEDGKPPATKEIIRLMDEGPLVDSQLLDLAAWIAETYACSWGEALSATVPGGVRKETAAATVLWARLAVEPDVADVEAAKLAEKQPKRSRTLRILMERPDGLALRDLARATQSSDSPARTLAKHGFVALDEREVVRDPFGDRPAPSAPPPTPTPEQVRAIDAVNAAIHENRHDTFVLFGVTGSGKTEVYLRAIAAAAEAGRQSIVLVPEIALTPQTVRRFRERFERVAVLHSALTDAERRRQWRAIRAGKADVIIGPRSAVFAPVPRLGLIVLDEEHETSFKQQSAPRYHARAVARERARRANSPVILGSATPSLEAWAGAHGRNATLLELPKRVGAGTMPKVEIIDMKREHVETKKKGLFSRRLIQIAKRSLQKRQQVLMFLNRRGFATSIYCGRCSATVSCERCSVTLTFHRGHGTVLCHPCGFERPLPRTCPECGSPGLVRLGAGTERLEDVVAACFPGARMARMDSDSMHDRGSYEEVLGAFGARELDLLVGTQMLAKGLHFPDVTCVGVISADTSLTQPDFRAAERTFQLVAQVAGRAGRSKDRGTVIVQTTQTAHPAIRHAASHDFPGFAAYELAIRQRFGWPPFRKLIRAVISSREDGAAERRAHEIADGVRAALPPGAADVLGPARCPLMRVKNRFRWHMVIKAADEPVQRAALMRLRRFSRRARKTELMLDVDPIDLT